jgi:hypothetical protein
VLSLPKLDRSVKLAGFGVAPQPASSVWGVERTYRYSRRLLVAMVAWALFVWTTRIKNAWADDAASVASKSGAILLSLSFVVFAVGGIVLLWRNRTGPALVSSRGALILRAFAAWTTAVWIVFATIILVHHHPVAFKAVHVTLGLISIALSALLWRSTVDASSAEPALAR